MKPSDHIFTLKHCLLPGSRFHCQTGLPDAARTGQGQQATIRILNEARDLRQTD
ncbi:MAG TPA: hypothetical protein VI524_07685 [Anaerolineales bacterium]|nr:hypothetical protein [Anaerolineales bacterium]